MKLETAKTIAEALAAELSPACHRIEVAGSIRRRKSEVKDVEIVAIPLIEERDARGQADLFGPRAERVSLAWEALERLRLAGRVRPIAPGTPRDSAGHYPNDGRWTEKRLEDSRYLRLWLPRPRITVDLFLTTPERWGATLVIRTGSDDFNRELVTRCRAAGARFGDGSVLVGGREIPTPEEKDVFRACGFRFVAPELRTGAEALVGLESQATH